MYCVFLLCASLYISLPHTCLCAEVDLLPFESIIHDYFKSESVQRLRKEWEVLRKPFENMLVKFMKDIESAGTNVYIRMMRNTQLARGYFHSDNQVRVIFKDLILEATPKCLLADVKFTLASNVLKVSSTLSTMIIHADYVLIRNKSDIIHDPKDQDPYKSSPFLFEQVHDVGKVAIRMDGCELKGFLTLVMEINEIDFGHDRFILNNCLYTIEIYRPGDESPPVIATYNFSVNHGLGLTDFVKTPSLTYSLVPKLQGAMYTFVNNSAIFGYSQIHEYRKHQEIVLMLTRNQIAEVVRQMNKLTVKKNNGAIKMADYQVHWDDGRIKPSKKNEAGTGETMRLTQMVLTGLDTLYSAHIGAPLEFNTVRIVEKLRFSSLQVRGKLEIISTWSDIFDFAAEISDLTVDLHIELSKNISKSGTWIEDRKLQVEGLRKIIFILPTLIFGSAENLIGGYVLKEVPKLINSHVMTMFDQAMQERSETKQKPPILVTPDAGGRTKPPILVTPDAGGRTKPHNQVISDAGALSDSKYEVDGLMVSEYYDEIPINDLLIIENGGKKSESENPIDDLIGKRERDTFKKNKKRFKRPNHPRRHHRGRNIRTRVANNAKTNKIKN